MSRSGSFTVSTLTPFYQHNIYSGNGLNKIRFWSYQDALDRAFEEFGFEARSHYAEGGIDSVSGGWMEITGGVTLSLDPESDQHFLTFRASNFLDNFQKVGIHWEATRSEY